MATIKGLINELDNLFKIFNYKYFNSELTKPIITIMTNGKDNNVLGWCTTRKAWADTSNNEEYYEITICAEHLYRDITEICSTLLHEMAHLYNLQNNIKDVSRGNTYHNKYFKETAEKCGLVVEFEKKYGWSFSKPTQDTIDFINNLKLDNEEFTLTRKLFNSTEKGNKGKRQVFRKYICPICGMAVRATKEVNVMCGDCQEIMLEEEK